MSIIVQENEGYPSGRGLARFTDNQECFPSCNRDVSDNNTIIFLFLFSSCRKMCRGRARYAMGRSHQRITTSYFVMAKVWC